MICVYLIYFSKLKLILFYNRVIYHMQIFLILLLCTVQDKAYLCGNAKSSYIYIYIYWIYMFWFGWVLWHINHYGLSNAKSSYIYIYWIYMFWFGGILWHISWSFLPNGVCTNQNFMVYQLIFLTEWYMHKPEST